MSSYYSSWQSYFYALVICEFHLAHSITGRILCLTTKALEFVLAVPWRLGAALKCFGYMVEIQSRSLTCVLGFNTGWAE